MNDQVKTLCSTQRSDAMEEEWGRKVPLSGNVASVNVIKSFVVVHSQVLGKAGGRHDAVQCLLNLHSFNEMLHIEGRVTVGLVWWYT